MITRRMLLSAIAAASGGLSACFGNVAILSDAPITMIVPFPAGGALDTVARSCPNV